jgi:opacity protein-like surface antigen
MKTLVAASALLIALASPMALAQDHSATPPSPENSSNSKGTSPEGMSSSGWSGAGLGGVHTGKSNETTGSGQRESSSEPTSDQPEMATGQNLKGPPHRFPANNTPE